jgi:segregation and condensation protein A
MPQQGRDIFLATAQRPEMPVVPLAPTLDLNELAKALQEVLRRAALTAHHQVKREQLSIRERMSKILSRITESETVHFANLFTVEEGRMGVVVTFIAILELLKQTLITLVQDEPYGAIQVRSVQTAIA